MNNRPLLGTTFGPGSSSGYGSSRPVMSVNRKKSGVCESIICSLCFVKKSHKLRMACFQCINQIHSFRHVHWFGNYSLRIEPLAYCCTRSVALLREVWLSESERLVSFMFVERLEESRQLAVQKLSSCFIKLCQLKFLGK